jgi:hypothetical protein
LADNDRDPGDVLASNLDLAGVKSDADVDPERP